MEAFTNTEEEMMQEAARFFQERRSVRESATLVALSGALGAGKTTYVRGALRSAGVTSSVTSPTFVFMKEYTLPHGNIFKNLIHIDAYRIEKPDMLHTIVPEDVFTNKQNIIFFEWPEQVKGSLPQPAHTIAIETLPDLRRKITYGN